MRTIPTPMRERWEAGGPFVGDAGRPNGYVTVQPDWSLHETSSVTTPITSKLPFRWFQNLDNDQTEIVVPNVRAIVKDRSLDADSNTCEIVMVNTRMGSNVGNPGGIGQPGYYSWDYGSPAAAARWGQVIHSWSNVLIPNALLRTYQGYGGWDGNAQIPLADAIEAGYVVLTGLWLIDEVTPSTNALQTIKCRDMFKLLIEQPIYGYFAGIIPYFRPVGHTEVAYPLDYRRYWYEEIVNPAVPVYDFTDPVASGPGGEGPKYITDVSMSADGKGYWLVGTDGGVFTFGTKFYGSRGGVTDTDSMVSIAADPRNHGYWLLSEDGGVFTEGDVDFFGAGAGGGTPNYRRIRAHPSGDGYWTVRKDGTVEAFGAAVHHGDHPATAFDIIDICPTKSGNGYWLLAIDGAIYTYGDALFYGRAAASLDISVAMCATPDGKGYWIVSWNGVLRAYGSAPTLRLNGADYAGHLNDPMVGIAATPTGHGVVLAGGDGGVFTYGDGPFYGSLPAGFTYFVQHPGNYLDYRDIVKDLLRWAGFLAYGDGGDSVYGTLEATGAFSDDKLPKEMFDKVPVIDALKKIKEVVGYNLWCGDEGEARFQQPNWYALGNLIEDNSRVEDVPEIDERIQLVDYSVPYNDKSTRSSIIVASVDPTAGLDAIVSTEAPLTSPLLRGMKRPMMIVNGNLTNIYEQWRMIDLIKRHLEFAYRPGSATCWATPMIQLNDQVRIYERQTAETAIHYVRGIHDEMVLDSSGEASWMMSVTTIWLGEADDFVLTE
jgi:hypothetical protein